ncbi:MAG TPA: alkaline phosphatase D family protein [Dehalococcoidia bacterium]|nr:alkaline phosphatase D family protein [Dehalococcoidia bacterium]
MTRYASRLLPLALWAGLLAMAACGDDDDETSEPIEADPGFAEGVAAGAVTDGEATLWTRYEGDGVTGEVARDSEFEEIVRDAELTPDEEADSTVHWGVEGLDAETVYYYRFVSDDGASPAGSFITAPSPDDDAAFTFAMSGDADGTRDEAGDPTVNGFELFDAMRADEPDFFLFAGDTVYADSFNAPEPAVTLDEFRVKHRENRGYQPLRDFLASTAVFPSIDDHEVVDDFGGSSVEPELYAAGYRSFRDYYPFGGELEEWNGVDGPDGAPELYESFRWGSSAEFFILDTRTYRSETAYCELPSGDRDNLPASGVPEADQALTQLRSELGYPPEADEDCVENLDTEARTMLGEQQKEWLYEGLRESDATFKFVMVSGPIQELFIMPYDRWEAYPAERQEILDFVADEAIQNVIFLSTDIHGSFINQVTLDALSDEEPVAVEVVTGPIASIQLGQLLDGIIAQNFAQPYAQFIEQEAGAECVEIFSYAYAFFQVDSDAVTVQIKDDAGEILCEETFEAA